jgi:hypothetical protein
MRASAGVKIEANDRFPESQLAENAWRGPEV